MNWIKSAIEQKMTKTQNQESNPRVDPTSGDAIKHQTFLEKLSSQKNSIDLGSNRLNTDVYSPENQESFVEKSYDHIYSQTEEANNPGNEGNDVFSQHRQSASVSNISQNRSKSRRSRSNRRYARSKPKPTLQSRDNSEKSSDINATAQQPRKRTMYTNMYLDPSFDVINLSKQNSSQKHDKVTRYTKILNSSKKAGNITTHQDSGRHLNSFLRKDNRGTDAAQNSITYLSQNQEDESTIFIGSVKKQQSALNPGEHLQSLKLDNRLKSDNKSNFNSTQKSKKKKSNAKKMKSSEKKPTLKKTAHKRNNSSIYDYSNQAVKLTQGKIYQYAEENDNAPPNISPFELPSHSMPVVQTQTNKNSNFDTPVVYQTNRITSSFLKSEEEFPRKVNRSTLHTRKGSNVEMFSQYSINTDTQEGQINMVTEPNQLTNEKRNNKNMHLYQVLTKVQNKKNGRLQKFITGIPKKNLAASRSKGINSDLEYPDVSDVQEPSSKEDSGSMLTSPMIGTNEEVTQDQKNQVYDPVVRAYPKTKSNKVSLKEQLSEIENIIMKDLQEQKNNVVNTEVSGSPPKRNNTHEFNETETVIRSRKLTPSHSCLQSPKRPLSKVGDGAASTAEIKRQRSKGNKKVANPPVKHNRLLNQLLEQPMVGNIQQNKVESKYTTNQSSKHVSTRKKDIIRTTKNSSNKGSAKMNQTQSVKELLDNIYKPERYSPNKDIEKFHNNTAVESLRVVTEDNSSIFLKQRLACLQDPVNQDLQKFGKKASQPGETYNKTSEEPLLLKNNLVQNKKNLRSTSTLREMADDKLAKKRLEEALKHKPREMISELKQKSKNLLDRESKLSHIKQGVLSNKYPRLNNTSQLSATMSSGQLTGAVTKPKQHGLYSATKSSIYSNTTPKVFKKSHGSGSLGEKETSKNSSSANNEKSLENIAEQDDDAVDPSQNVNLDMSSNEDFGEVSLSQIQVNYQMKKKPKEQSVDGTKKQGSRLRSTKAGKSGFGQTRSTLLNHQKQQHGSSANLSYNVSEATRKSKFRNQYLNNSKHINTQDPSFKNSPKGTRLGNVGRFSHEMETDLISSKKLYESNTNVSALSKAAEKKAKTSKKNDDMPRQIIEQQSNIYNPRNSNYISNKQVSRPQSSVADVKKAGRTVLENIQNTNGIREKKTSIQTTNQHLSQFLNNNAFDMEKSRSGYLYERQVRKQLTSSNTAKPKNPIASHQQSICMSSNIISQLKTRDENKSLVRNQRSVPMSSKAHQQSIQLPSTGKSVKQNHGFAKDLLDSEKEKFGDRCPQGFKKLKLLGKGGIALVWLMRVTGDKLGSSLEGKEVALKQFPKTKSNPFDSTAVNEIEIGNLMFPMQVKEGCEGDNDEEFERGFALDTEENPGMKNISKLLDIIDEKQDLWLVYEVGSECLSKHLHEVKGEFFKGERIYNIQHQQFYNSLLNSKKILVTLIMRVAQTLDVFSKLNIVHSDIKPDNILVKLNEDFTDIENLKFIDFGSAFTHDNFSNISGTTPEYLPPEILNYLDKRSAKPHLAALVQKAQHPWSFDVWSFGIILLEILTGFPIWMSLKCRLKTSSGKNLLGTGLFGVQGREGKKILLKQQTVFKNIRHTLKKYDCYGFEENDQLLDLIEGMLETNPQKRISPSEILQHPFIVEQ